MLVVGEGVEVVVVVVVVSSWIYTETRLLMGPLLSLSSKVTIA